jgi:hypothetical protein
MKVGLYLIRVVLCFAAFPIAMVLGQLFSRKAIRHQSLAEICGILTWASLILPAAWLLTAMLDVGRSNTTGELDGLNARYIPRLVAAYCSLWLALIIVIAIAG